MVIGFLLDLFDLNESEMCKYIFLTIPLKQTDLAVWINSLCLWTVDIMENGTLNCKHELKYLTVQCTRNK